MKLADVLIDLKPLWTGEALEVRHRMEARGTVNVVRTEQHPWGYLHISYDQELGRPQDVPTVGGVESDDPKGDPREEGSGDAETGQSKQ
jgi:hypothetical protein